MKDIGFASRTFIHRLAREQGGSDSALQDALGCKTENNKMSSWKHSSTGGKETVFKRRQYGVGSLGITEILLDNTFLLLQQNTYDKLTKRKDVW